MKLYVLHVASYDVWKQKKELYSGKYKENRKYNGKQSSKKYTMLQPLTFKD